MNAIKYSILGAVGVYFVYGEVRAGLDYWLPAVGYAAEHGYVWTQFAFLAIVGAPDDLRVQGTRLDSRLVRTIIANHSANVDAYEGALALPLTELSRGGSGYHVSAPASHLYCLSVYVTVKVPELVAVPPGAVTVIFSVFAPVGTVTVIFVYEFTVSRFSRL